MLADALPPSGSHVIRASPRATDRADLTSAPKITDRMLEDNPIDGAALHLLGRAAAAEQVYAEAAALLRSPQTLAAEAL